MLVWLVCVIFAALRTHVSVLVLVALALALARTDAFRLPRGPSSAPRPDNHPGVENCTERWFTQVCPSPAVWCALPQCDVCPA